MTVLRSGAAALLLLALVGCRRDPDAWPPAALKAERDACPALYGAPGMCACYADLLSRKLPLSRARTWTERGSPTTPEYADVFAAFVDSARSCAPHDPPGTWPAAVRELFVKGCLTGEGLTPRICECLRERFEPKLRSWEVAVNSFEVLAGRKSLAEYAKQFEGSEYLQCAALDDMPWGPLDRSKLVSQCEATGSMPPSLCTCYAERIMATTRLSDVARAELPGDAGVQAKTRFEASARAALRACLKPAKASAKVRRR